MSTCCAGRARWCSQLSVSARPGRPGGMACRDWPAGCMLGDGARGSASFDPQRAGAPFCDVICIILWSILRHTQGDRAVRLTLLTDAGPPYTSDVRSAHRGVYGMSKFYGERRNEKKVITPRYNSTATPAACKTIGIRRTVALRPPQNFYGNRKNHSILEFYGHRTAAVE